MFKPYAILKRSNPKFKSLAHDTYAQAILNDLDPECNIFVSMDPNGKIARMIPLDWHVESTYQLIAELFNEHYISFEIEKEILIQQNKESISKMNKDMEKMERDLYLQLEEKENEINKLKEEIEYLKS